MASPHINVNPEEIGETCSCPYCQKPFARSDTLARHIRLEICTKPKPSKKELQHMIMIQYDRFERLEKSMEVMKTEIAKLKEKPQVANTNNQNLSVMCLSSNDNLLDMLTASEGGLYNPPTFMRGCALSRVAGDCRVLEKAYGLTTLNPAIMCTDKSSAILKPWLESLPTYYKAHMVKPSTCLIPI